MKITPIDISGHRFAKRMRGYDSEEVHSFLNLVSSEFEKVIIVRGTHLIDQAARKAGELEGAIQMLRIERTAFEQRIRSAVEQHIKVLDMHRREDEVEGRLRFMKKPPQQKV